MNIFGLTSDDGSHLFIDEKELIDHWSDHGPERKMSNITLEAGKTYHVVIESGVERPMKELKGFAKISLKPGEQKVVEFELTPSSFAFYAPEKKEWMVESGEYDILIGSSSRDIRCRTLLKH